MTCREKLKIDYPYCWEAIIVDECPSDYGYLENPDQCDLLLCTECWDREIPGTDRQTTEDAKDPYSYDFEITIDTANGRVIIDIENGKITEVHTEMKKES